MKPVVQYKGGRLNTFYLSSKLIQLSKNRLNSSLRKPKASLKVSLCCNITQG